MPLLPPIRALPISRDKLTPEPTPTHLLNAWADAGDAKSQVAAFSLPSKHQSGHVPLLQRGEATVRSATAMDYLNSSDSNLTPALIYLNKFNARGAAEKKALRESAAQGQASPVAATPGIYMTEVGLTNEKGSRAVNDSNAAPLIGSTSGSPTSFSLQMGKRPVFIGKKSFFKQGWHAYYILEGSDTDNDSAFDYDNRSNVASTSPADSPSPRSSVEGTSPRRRRRRARQRAPSQQAAGEKSSPMRQPRIMPGISGRHLKALLKLPLSERRSRARRREQFGAEGAQTSGLTHISPLIRDYNEKALEQLRGVELLEQKVAVAGLADTIGYRKHLEHKPEHSLSAAKSSAEELQRTTSKTDNTKVRERLFGGNAPGMPINPRMGKAALEKLRREKAKAQFRLPILADCYEGIETLVEAQSQAEQAARKRYARAFKQGDSDSNEESQEGHEAATSVADGMSISPRYNTNSLGSTITKKQTSEFCSPVTSFMPLPPPPRIQLLGQPPAPPDEDLPPPLLLPYTERQWRHLTPYHRECAIHDARERLLQIQFIHDEAACAVAEARKRVEDLGEPSGGDAHLSNQVFELNEYPVSRKGPAPRFRSERDWRIPPRAGVQQRVFALRADPAQWFAFQSHVVDLRRIAKKSRLQYSKGENIIERNCHPRQLAIQTPVARREQLALASASHEKKKAAAAARRNDIENNVLEKFKARTMKLEERAFVKLQQRGRQLAMLVVLACRSRQMIANMMQARGIEMENLQRSAVNVFSRAWRKKKQTISYVAAFLIRARFLRRALVKARLRLRQRSTDAVRNLLTNLTFYNRVMVRFRVFHFKVKRCLRLWRSRIELIAFQTDLRRSQWAEHAQRRAADLVGEISRLQDSLEKMRRGEEVFGDTEAYGLSLGTSIRAGSSLAMSLRFKGSAGPPSIGRTARLFNLEQQLGEAEGRLAGCRALTDEDRDKALADFRENQRRTFYADWDAYATHRQEYEQALRKNPERASALRRAKVPRPHWRIIMREADLGAVFDGAVQKRRAAESNDFTTLGDHLSIM